MLQLFGCGFVLTKLGRFGHRKSWILWCPVRVNKGSKRRIGRRLFSSRVQYGCNILRYSVLVHTYSWQYDIHYMPYNYDHIVYTPSLYLCARPFSMISHAPPCSAASWLLATDLGWPRPRLFARLGCSAVEIRWMNSIQFCWPRKMSAEAARNLRTALLHIAQWSQ